MFQVALCGVLAMAEPGPRARTLLLELDGAVVEKGSGPTQSSCVVDEQTEIPAFPIDDAARSQLVAKVRELLSAYDVHVVDVTPPALLPYDRVVLGGDDSSIGWGPGAGPVGFTCHVDCRDEDAGDVSQIFDIAADQLDVEQVAQLVVHEAAHGWGLEHVEDRDDLMYRFPAAEGATFGSGCIASDGPIYCEEGHEEVCPPGRQDAHGELLRRFGPAVIDTTPLSVRIVFPQDGAVLAPATWGVVFEIDDESAGAGSRVDVLDLGVSIIGADPGTAHAFEFVQAGDYSIVVDVVDHDGDVAHDEIRFTIDPGEVSSMNEPIAGCAMPTRPNRWWGLVIIVAVARRRGGRSGRPTATAW